MEHIICENIKRLRENAGYNQQSIAEFLHVDQSLISKIEKGECSISADMLEKLASLFGVSVVDLSSKPITKTLSCAFKCSELTADEMEVISSINRIAINSEFMQKIIEEHKN